MERAVDAKPHTHLVTLRFDVHVGRAITQCLRDDQVHHLHDRRVHVDALHGGLL